MCESSCHNLNSLNDSWTTTTTTTAAESIHTHHSFTHTRLAQEVKQRKWTEEQETEQKMSWNISINCNTHFEFRWTLTIVSLSHCPTVWTSVITSIQWIITDAYSSRFSGKYPSATVAPTLTICDFLKLHLCIR